MFHQDTPNFTSANSQYQEAQGHAEKLLRSSDRGRNPSVIGDSMTKNDLEFVMDDEASETSVPTIGSANLPTQALAELTESPRPDSKSDATKARELSRRKWLGRILVIAGGVGVMLSTLHPKEANVLIGPSAFWNGILMISMIVMVAGIPGAYHGYIRSTHLKVIDLLWVLASGVAVYIAIVQTSQYFPELQRAEMAKTLEKSRAKGHEWAVKAYHEKCDSATELSDAQCEDVRYIANMLVDGTWLSRDRVVDLCHYPFNVDNPPHGFGFSLIQTCMISLTIVGINEEPIMKDKHNAEQWRFESTLWPIFMSILVSLRIMKSIAEVFWLRSS